MRLDGRHALITGGLGTIGQAMAAEFREARGQVTLLDRPDLAPSKGHGWLPADLRDPEAAEAAVAAAGPSTSSWTTRRSSSTSRTKPSSSRSTKSRSG